MDAGYRPIGQSEIATWLSPRSADCHKGDFGNVGIVGGAQGMGGAALLAGRAALWLGAGRVYCGVLDERIAVDFLAPELMLAGPEKALSIAPPGCLVVGPGLGRAPAAHHWLDAALASELPLVLDADALNLIALEPALADAVRDRDAATLLTPHPGEAGRLLGRSTDAVQRDRPAAVCELAERFRCGAVLKGAGSLVHFPAAPVWHNDTGNPGMAAPGMGDVLAGMIGALAAPGLALERAAVAAVHLHGAAGDRAVGDRRGPVGATAGELAPRAPEGLNSRSYGAA